MKKNIKSAKAPRILVLNGPNLHILGKREPEIYGECTLPKLKKLIAAKARELGLELEQVQTNSEGKMVDIITRAGFDFLIINPAAYTHTSVAIRDAILAVNKPAIEVHISNIYKREDFRKTSLISDVVTGVISGLGTMSYLLALEAAKKNFSEK